MNAAASLAGNTAAAATSSGKPGRGTGCHTVWKRSKTPRTASAERSASMLPSPAALPKIPVTIGPGERLFTRTPTSPSSAATDRVRWISAAFAAE
jgi:hypothetical protein